ncbi:hypothetical protein INT48_004000 [Thamnidium elegans]|uniref:Mitochondrial import inner membrane translocase subunit n=1 Tax=Thamnidium elegans TaxID=101142 RepID=A0A8H7SGA7_9FUNG|nr:hypothetical protein INT48_004000 [Thamnidium elegans]
MSFFGGNMQSQQQTINPQNIALAEQELEMVTDLFNRITESCHKKCISKEYTQGELNQGEAVCIDRCVAKFLDVNSKVGEKMQQMGGSA